jgi:GABA permease
MAAVGPPVVASYIVAGVMLLAMLRVMARARRAMPGALFITDFVQAGLGGLAGSVAAWIYWLFWTLVATIEAMAGANILVPDGGPVALLTSIGLLVTMIGIGEKVSASLSEREVGFSCLKVAVIVAFIALAASHLTGSHLAGSHIDWPSWGADAGATLSLLGGVVITFFSLAGVEIVHAVANSPTCTERESARAIRLISIRVFGIYLVSITLILSIVRSDTIRPGFSPFTLTLEVLDHPSAARWLRALILIGVLTTLNASLAIGAGLLGRVREGLFTAGAANPAHRGSPRLITGAVALAALCAAAHWPSEAYAWLVKSESALLVAVYLSFVLAAGKLDAGAQKPGAPQAGLRRWSGRALIVSLAGILLAMACVPGSQGPLLSALCLVTLVIMLEAVRAPQPRGER